MAAMTADQSPPSGSFSWAAPPAAAGRKHPVVAYIRSRFITGALVAFPLVVTLFFARFLFNLLDRWSYPITQRLFGFQVPGAGAIVAIVLIFATGMLAHRVLGRRLLHFGDNLAGRVPVLGPIYRGAREITKAFSGDRVKEFRRVVLVPFPTDGIWSIAFLTGEFTIETPEGPRKMVSTFMPTTPNPTTGFFLIFPAERALASTLTVEEAVRMVISGGLIAPEPRRIFAPDARVMP